MKSPGYCPWRASPNQAGVALITVLLIVFIASIAATSLALLQQVAIRRSTVLQHQQQARLYTLGAEQWAIIVLIRDRQNSETDYPGEEWANLPPALPVENGALTARISDLQGCFNLNNLWRLPPGATASSATAAAKPNRPDEDGVEPAPEPDAEKADDKTKPTAPKSDKAADKAGIDPAQITVLQRLLTSLELKPELAQAVADWIDPDLDTLFPDGAEDSDYNILDPAYLAANRPFISASELRLVKDVDRETYDKLAPHVCALPPGVPINVNSASATVLAALGEGVTAKDLEPLLEEPPAEGYKNVDEFLNAARLTVEAPVKAGLGTASQYFLLRAEARVGDGRAMLYSTLYRDENGVRVLRRNFGNQPD